MARTTRHEVRGRPCVGICDGGSTMEFVPDHRKIETRTTSRAVNAARGEITPQHLCFSCQLRVLPDGRLPSTNRFWVPGRHRASGKTAWQDRSKTRPRVGGPVCPVESDYPLSLISRESFRDQQSNCLSHSPLVKLEMDSNEFYASLRPVNEENRFTQSRNKSANSLRHQHMPCSPSRSEERRVGKECR